MRRRAAKALAFILAVVFMPDPSLSQESASPEHALPPESAAALNLLHARPPAWLFPADACPADVMPETEREVDYVPGFCRAHLGACIEQCRTEDANACYALALAIEEVDLNDPAAEPIFLRACRLGIYSGCTNRAAGMINYESKVPGSKACAIRTFEKTCERNDPWGCTMYAIRLMRGDGVQKNLALAAHVLRKSCRFGDADRACTLAKDLLKEIDDKSPQPESPD